MNEEEKQDQIQKIISKLNYLDDSHILDIADNVHWGLIKFYDPTKYHLISEKQMQRIQDKFPELLI